MAHWDFVIIGGGIAGVSAAAELAPHGRTLVLERESALGYHATGRSAAAVVLNYGAPPLRSLTQASLPALLDTEVDGHRFAQRKGMLMLELQGQAGMLDSYLDDPARLGQACEVEVTEALRRVPILRREAIVRACWEPDLWALDADALLQWYRRRARSAGAEFRLHADVTALEARAGGWRVVAGEHVEDAAVVVNAAGAWADTVAALAGLRPLCLQPKRRTALTVPAPAGHDVQRWPAVIDMGETRYFKPDAGALMLSLADETDSPPCDAWAADEDVALAVDRVQQIANLPVERVIACWAGLRTFAPDRLPVIGLDEEAPGFFWLAGQGGYGLQTAPALAQLTRDIVLGRPASASLMEWGIRPADSAPARLKARPAATSPSSDP
jgi:D-arginine dehydrogenase